MGSVEFEDVEQCRAMDSVFDPKSARTPLEL